MNLIMKFTANNEPLGAFLLVEVIEILSFTV